MATYASILRRIIKIESYENDNHNIRVSSYRHQYYKRTGKKYMLDFNPDKYRVDTAEVNGESVIYRAYENIVYVKNPIDIRYQCLNDYITTEYFERSSISAYNIKKSSDIPSQECKSLYVGKIARLE